MRYRRTSPDSPPDPTASVDLEQAWRILSLVIDQVRHAESKLTVVLGVATVSGGVLYNFVSDNHDSGTLFMSVTGLCGSTVLTSVICSMIGLAPVLRVRRHTARETNPLFFGGIADAHSSDSSTYAPALRAVSGNPEEMMRHLSQQIFINSVVAQRKYWWADRAIQALAINILSLSALTVISALPA